MIMHWKMVSWTLMEVRFDKGNMFIEYKQTTKQRQQYFTQTQPAMVLGCRHAARRLVDATHPTQPIQPE